MTECWVSPPVRRDTGRLMDWQCQSTRVRCTLRKVRGCSALARPAHPLTNDLSARPSAKEVSPRDRTVLQRENSSPHVGGLGLRLCLVHQTLGRGHQPCIVHQAQKPGINNASLTHRELGTSMPVSVARPWDPARRLFPIELVFSNRARFKNIELYLARTFELCKFGK